MRVERWGAGGERSGGWGGGDEASRRGEEGARRPGRGRWEGRRSSRLSWKILDKCDAFREEEEVEEEVEVVEVEVVMTCECLAVRVLQGGGVRAVVHQEQQQAQAGERWGGLRERWGGVVACTPGVGEGSGAPALLLLRGGRGPIAQGQ